MVLVAQTPLPSPPPGVDPNFLISQLIPLIGAVAAMIVGGVVLYAFFKSDLASALGERIRAGMHRRKHWKGLGGSGSTSPATRATRGAWPSWKSTWASCRPRWRSWRSG